MLRPIAQFHHPRQLVHRHIETNAHGPHDAEVELDIVADDHVGQCYLLPEDGATSFDGDTFGLAHFGSDVMDCERAILRPHAVRKLHETAGAP